MSGTTQVSPSTRTHKDPRLPPQRRTPLSSSRCLDTTRKQCACVACHLRSFVSFRPRLLSFLLVPVRALACRPQFRCPCTCASRSDPASPCSRLFLHLRACFPHSRHLRASFPFSFSFSFHFMFAFAFRLRLADLPTEPPVAPHPAVAVALVSALFVRLLVLFPSLFSRLVCTALPSSSRLGVLSSAPSARCWRRCACVHVRGAFASLRPCVCVCVTVCARSLPQSCSYPCSHPRSHFAFVCAVVRLVSRSRLSISSPIPFRTLLLRSFVYSPIPFRRSHPSRRIPHIVPRIRIPSIRPSIHPSLPPICPSVPFSLPFLPLFLPSLCSSPPLLRAPSRPRPLPHHFAASYARADPSSVI